MDRAKFFASLRARASGVFGTSLSQAQVDGTEAILDSCRRNRIANIHHVANVLAQVAHETGGYMLPIKETVYASHKNKNPSDATVIARLDRAYAKGQLPWVKTPYWRDGFFGRGPIMITHRDNYAKLGRRLNVGLAGNPDLALDPRIGADIAVIGMSEGLFTGKKLSDYDFPKALRASWQHNPRRIVNGKDGTDTKVAGYHRAFFDALEAGGWQPDPAPIPTPKPETPDALDRDPVARPDPEPRKGNWLSSLVSALVSFIRNIIRR